MTVKEIKNEARERFSVSRNKAMPVYCVVFFIVVNILVVSAVLFVVTMGLPKIVSWVFYGYGGLLLLTVLFLMGPFSYSMVDYYLRAYKEKDVTPAFALDGFGKANFGRVVIAHLLHMAFTFLLTCLLIVPGIIFAVKTSMMFHLMRANPSLKPMAAMKSSSKIMKGHSWRYFTLILSFIGWWLLGIVTLGTGFIYLFPYFNSCKAVFYKRELQKDTTVYSASASKAVEKPQTVQEDVVVPVVPENTETYVETVTEEDDGSFAPAEDFAADDDDTVVVVTEDDSAAEEVEVVLDTEQPETVEVVTEQTDEEQTVAVPVHDEAEEPPKTVDTGKPDPKEAIRQRIEQLKREREKHTARPQRPEKHERPAPPVTSKTATPTKPTVQPKPQVKDEFAPQKIDVEIVEE